MFGGADDERLQHMAAQAPAVGVGDMGDPALNGGVQFGEADLAAVKRGPK